MKVNSNIWVLMLDESGFQKQKLLCYLSANFIVERKNQYIDLKKQKDGNIGQEYDLGMSSLFW